MYIWHVVMFDQEFTICNFLFNLEQKQNGCFLSLAFWYLCVCVCVCAFSGEKTKRWSRISIVICISSGVRASIVESAPELPQRVRERWSYKISTVKVVFMTLLHIFWLCKIAAYRSINNVNGHLQSIQCGYVCMPSDAKYARFHFIVSFLLLSFAIIHAETRAHVRKIGKSITEVTIEKWIFLEHETSGYYYKRCQNLWWWRRRQRRWRYKGRIG